MRLSFTASDRGLGLLLTYTTSHSSAKPYSNPSDSTSHRIMGLLPAIGFIGDNSTRRGVIGSERLLILCNTHSEAEEDKVGIISAAVTPSTKIRAWRYGDGVSVFTVLFQSHQCHHFNSHTFLAKVILFIRGVGVYVNANYPPSAEIKA